MGKKVKGTMGYGAFVFFREKAIFDKKIDTW